MLAVLIAGAVLFVQNKGGEIFVEDIGNELEKLNVIRINTPRPNQTISSPLMIEGEARGVWFFEASFPIKILDENGNILKESFATAQGDPANGGVNWMTEDFVPLKAEIEFQTPNNGKGALILEKDNPSGLPEHDDALRVPIRFAKDALP